jgi:dTDP-4-dehydrorhamnose reductase
MLNEADSTVPIHRVLIVGVSSYIGSALAISLRDDFEVFGSYHFHPCRIEGVHCFHMDVLDGAEILETVRRFQPSIVIYCAGVNDRNKAEQEASRADALNFKAPTIFFKLLPSNMHFLYFSPDEVFGQHQIPAGRTSFKEDDLTMPLNQLAKTKHNGENLVLNHKRFTGCFRVGNIYGEVMGCPFNQKYTWVTSLQSALERGENPKLATNLLRTFVYIGDVARAVKLYLKNRTSTPELFHLASKSSMSFHAFGQLYAETFGFDSALIKGASYSHPKGKERPPEAVNCSLDASKFEKTYDFKFQSAEEGLKEMYARLHMGWTRKWA